MRKYSDIGLASLLLATVFVAGCASRVTEEPVPEPAFTQTTAAERGATGAATPLPPPPRPLESTTTFVEDAPPPTAGSADDVRFNEVPLKYTVKKGDTLWGIASYFLKDPWQWPELWIVNRKQVRNPHLIYPGEELEIVFRGGRPQLIKSGAVVAQEKMSPRVREEPGERAIPTIPIDAIRQFLKGPRVVSGEELRRAPYVVEFSEDHITGSAGMGAYVKNLRRDEAIQGSFDVVRRGDEYRDPETKELLGYEAIPTALAELREYGSPSIVWLVESMREVMIGDRLLPSEARQFEANFYPHAPDAKVGARIISVFNGLSQIGQFQIVTLNRGARNGLEVGHVLSVLKAGRRVPDPYDNSTVQLPDQYSGTLLIFKVAPKVSYGLIMEARQPIHVLDKAEKPVLGEKDKS